MNAIMTIRATKELQNKIGQEANKMGISRNALVLQILWDWLKRK